MKKKVTRPTTEEILQGNLPDEVAIVFHAYYQAFLSKGFTSDQAFTLTVQIADFYLHGK